MKTRWSWSDSSGRKLVGLVLRADLVGQWVCPLTCERLLHRSFKIYYSTVNLLFYCKSTILLQIYYSTVNLLFYCKSTVVLSFAQKQQNDILVAKLGLNWHFCFRQQASKMTDWFLLWFAVFLPFLTFGGSWPSEVNKGLFLLKISMKRQNNSIYGYL